jgi:hypothetical protein
MSVGRWSRHRFSTVQTDAAGRRWLSPRPRFRYLELPDNRAHVVKQGDTLHRLAHRYFPGMGPPALDGDPRPANLFWVIADFQPEPIHDVTVVLDAGRVLVIPSVRTVQELVFSNARKREVASP